MNVFAIGSSRTLLSRISLMIMLLAVVCTIGGSSSESRAGAETEDSRDHRVCAFGPHAISAANRGRGEDVEPGAHDL